MREFALGRRAAVALLEPRRAAAQVRGDRLAAGGEHAHHLPADARDLEPVAVIARGPFQAEPGGEGFFQVLGDDRGDRADVLVIAERVRRPPLPVGAGPGDVGYLGMDVQLHVTVPRGVLQPVRHRQARLVPLASFPAVDAGAVGAGAGVAGFALEVAEPGVHGFPDHVIDLADQGGPVPIAVFVAGLAGQADVLAEGGVEDRDRLRQRNRQVKEQGALPGPVDSLGPEFALALGSGMRLGGQKLRVQVGGFAAAARGPAQLSAVGAFALAEQQVVRLALDPSGRARSREPWLLGPTTGQAALRHSRWPGCSSWPRPWPGRGRPASRCSQGHSPCSASRQLPLSPAPPRRGRSRTAHTHLMVHGCDARDLTMHYRVTKRPIKIRNERRSRWPEGSSWPRPSPGRGPRASRCSPGHSLCSGSRQLPLGAAPRRRPAVSRAAHAHRMMHGCDARNDHVTQGCAKRPIKIRNEKRTKWICRTYLVGHRGCRTLQSRYERTTVNRVMADAGVENRT